MKDPLLFKNVTNEYELKNFIQCYGKSIKRNQYETQLILINDDILKVNLYDKDEAFYNDYCLNNNIMNLLYNVFGEIFAYKNLFI